MADDIRSAYERLSRWCRAQDYAGYDLFDGLNSRLFRTTPLNRWPLARLAFTQFFKRSPVNFRRLALVPKARNPKGTALFALAKLADFQRTNLDADAAEARELLQNLLFVKLPQYSGAAWGYHFDWQGRAFYAPKGTPTIVPTAFAVRALIAAHQTLADPVFLQTARSACDFILNDLKRVVETDDEICFSYSPLDETRVYNASLFAAESLATVGQLTGEPELCSLALRGARYVVRRQGADGSWAYGADDYQGWADNIHTAFTLSSLMRVMHACPASADEFRPALERGYRYWRDAFFLADGWPKYFPDRLFPADAHSAGAAITAFTDLQELDPQAKAHADHIAIWAIRNLQSSKGYFYYQRRRFYTVRTPYVRWSQAWMMYALTRAMKNG